jgi:GT2 family glycosyltransferase
VVDNGSWDGSAEKIKAWAEENLGPGHVLADYTQEIALQGGDPQTEGALENVPSPARLVLIRNEENLGFTGGNNLSISYALRRGFTPDYVFLLNNDVCLEPDCLAELVAAGRAAKAGIVGAVLKPFRNAEAVAESAAPKDGSGNANGNGKAVRLDSRTPWVSRRWVGGAATLLRRDFLETVRKIQGSYLDERLFMYIEDVALCRLAQKLGYKTVEATHAIGYHVAGGSSGGRYSPIDYYYGTRNALLLAATLEPAKRFRLYATLPVKTVGRILNNLLRGRPRSAHALFRGFVDACAGVDGKWKRHDREAGRGGTP